MRITEVNDEQMVFDDGTTISYGWDGDGYERNYADFEAIMDDELRESEFDFFELSLPEEEENQGGFFITFCGMPHQMLGTYDKKCWVPCYSEQNGYYTTELEIFVNDESTLKLYCEVDDYCPC